VVPDRKAPRGMPLRHVGCDPLHLAGAPAEPQRGEIERSRGNVERRDAAEAALDQAVDQARRPAADIDDFGVGAWVSLFDQFERGCGIILKPADLILAPGGIDRFPMVLATFLHELLTPHSPSSLAAVRSAWARESPLAS